MEKKSFIQIIYLYLFSAIGLILLMIGLVRFIDLGLKSTIFKEVGNLERAQQAISPRMPYINLERYEGEVSEEELDDIKRIIETYEREEQRWNDVDYYKAQKQREASISLAYILVGFPLYFYHWLLVKKL